MQKKENKKSISTIINDDMQRSQNNIIKENFFDKEVYFDINGEKILINDLYNYFNSLPEIESQKQREYEKNQARKALEMRLKIQQEKEINEMKKKLRALLNNKELNNENYMNLLVNIKYLKIRGTESEQKILNISKEYDEKKDMYIKQIQSLNNYYGSIKESYDTAEKEVMKIVFKAMDEEANVRRIKEKYESLKEEKERKINFNKDIRFVIKTFVIIITYKLIDILKKVIKSLIWSEKN